MPVGGGLTWRPQCGFGGGRCRNPAVCAWSVKATTIRAGHAGEPVCHEPFRQLGGAGTTASAQSAQIEGPAFMCRTGCVATTKVRLCLRRVRRLARSPPEIAAARPWGGSQRRSYRAGTLRWLRSGPMQAATSWPVMSQPTEPATTTRPAASITSSRRRSVTSLTE